MLDLINVSYDTLIPNNVGLSSDRRVRNRISPIQTNNGNAVSVHDEDERQMIVIIASPTGRA